MYLFEKRFLGNSSLLASTVGLFALGAVCALAAVLLPHVLAGIVGVLCGSMVMISLLRRRGIRVERYLPWRVYG